MYKCINHIFKTNKSPNDLKVESKLRVPSGIVLVYSKQREHINSIVAVKYGPNFGQVNYDTLDKITAPYQRHQADTINYAKPLNTFKNDNFPIQTSRGTNARPNRPNNCARRGRTTTT